mgnify:CR=1 FL=1
MSDALWGGRFTKTTDEMVNDFQASISFDRRLYREDIAGSIAHAAMLAKTGIITGEDRDAIVSGLRDILGQIDRGEFDFSVTLEDIHLNIEKRLTDAIGAAGGRLHTARSRNDQVALDTHMYLRREIVGLMELIRDLQQALLETADRHKEVIMPGYTHLQRAQPVLFSHHLMAYFFMLGRDFERLEGAYRRADIMPLGAGALAGTTFPIDREYVAGSLNFDRIYANSMDAVSDRDYALEFLSAAAIVMVHLSRLSEEICLWATKEFSFIELDDAHCTGSSIMPQKKNPDVSELVRGKTGRVTGHLMALLTVVKGLPLAYNKDLQEDKEGLFDTIDTLKFSLTVYAALIRGMKVREDVMKRAVTEDFSNATDLADYLARKGLPFRQAHAVAGAAVARAIERGVYLADFTLEELKELSPLFAEDIYEAISPETCVRLRNSLGGTGYDSVKRQLADGVKLLSEEAAAISRLSLRQIDPATLDLNGQPEPDQTE